MGKKLKYTLKVCLIGSVKNGSVEKVGYPIWGTWGSRGVVFGVPVFSMKNDFERITK